MKYTITFETGEPEKQDVPAKTPEIHDPHDVWRFGEIRETLWGKGALPQMPSGLYDLSGIRKTLWGR